MTAEWFESRPPHDQTLRQGRATKKSAPVPPLPSTSHRRVPPVQRVPGPAVSRNMPAIQSAKLGDSRPRLSGRAKPDYFSKYRTVVKERALAGSQEPAQLR